MTSLSDELENRVNAELRPGERLVWTGQPMPRRTVPASILVAVFFGLPWLGLTLCWMLGALALSFNGGPGGPQGFRFMSICFPLFGLPFVIIGLLIFSAPYWVYRRAKRTCYALTNQRAITFAANAFRGIEVRSFTSSDLEIFTRRESANGSGDLIFQEIITSHDRYGETNTRRAEYGFLGIENVREVEELIRQTFPTSQR